MRKTWRHLNDEEVEGILLAEGPYAEIAARFDVSLGTVQEYKGLRTPKARRGMARLRARGVVEPVRRGGGTRRFSDVEVEAIRASRRPSALLAKELGCAPSTIRMIRSGRTYR